jgi:hypothetical protein
MSKRTRKTPEQIYVDYWSTVPNWVEKMPLNKENLERFKKSSDFARLDLGNAFGVFVDELFDTPLFKALKKMADKMEHPSNTKLEPGFDKDGKLAEISIVKNEK